MLTQLVAYAALLATSDSGNSSPVVLVVVQGAGGVSCTALKWTGQILSSANEYIYRMAFRVRCAVSSALVPGAAVQNHQIG